jgi:hypothetical protein
MWTATVEHFMKIRYLTVAGIIAAMVALAGCETDDTWDDDPATTDTWDDQTRTEPERAPPAGTAAGAEQTWEYDPETQQTERADTGVTGTEPTTPQERTMDRQPTDGAADVDMTEFSALDTDATGTLTEEQWVPEAVGGVEFDEVDRDGDGTVTREEFREYFIEGPGAGLGAQQGTTQ